MRSRGTMRDVDATTAESLAASIHNRTARISVVGLGYVGIPVALSFAGAGFHVTGVERSAERVAALRRGQLPLAPDEPGLLSLLDAARAAGRFSAVTELGGVDADVYVVAVDTPIGADNRPGTRDLEDACREVEARIRGEAWSLVVVESTLPPGTMRRVVAPIFASKNVALVHCPERVRPGRLLRNLRSLSRLVGVGDPSAGVLGAALYGAIVQAELVVTSWETAELIKTAENTARDVQIALANQLAVVCDHAGVDFRTVREQINRLWSDQPLILEAGPGVGGHCLPKDPWLLASAVPSGGPTDLIEGTRRQNDGMVGHVVMIVERALRDINIHSRDARVAVLGLTYEADSDDTRNAAGPRLVKALRTVVEQVLEHDPHTTNVSLDSVVAGSDVAVVTVPHTAYRSADWGRIAPLMRHAVIVDCRRALDADVLQMRGFRYFGLGLGSLATT